MDYEDHVFKEAENGSDLNLETSGYPYDAQEIILTLIGFISIAANILLIYVICFFRKLHINTTNIYLVNWAIADVGVLIITISCFGIFDIILSLPDIMLCFYFGLSCGLLFTVMFFMITITADWCFSAFLPRPLEKFRKYTRVIIACVWILTGLYSIMSTCLCSLTDYYFLFHFVILITFALLLASVVILHCIRFVKRCKGHFEYYSVSLLYIPTVFVLCWLFSWINLWLIDVPAEFYIIFELPYFLHPIINFIILVTVDENFKICVFRLMKCLPCQFFKIKAQQFGEEPSNTEAQTAIPNNNFLQPNGHI